MESVKSGMLLNLLTGLIGMVDSALGKLQDIGLEVKDKKKDEEDGSIVYTVWYGDNDDEIHIKCIPNTDDDKKCTLRFKDGKQGEVTEVPDCDSSKIDKYIRDYIDNNYGEENSFTSEQTGSLEDAASSCKFRATFQRITSASEDIIKLTNVVCGTSTADIVLQSIDTLLDSDEFISEVNMEPTTFEIIDDGSDDLDVNAIEHIPDGDVSIYMQALISAYSVYNTACVCQFNTTGVDRDTICRMCEDFSYSIREQLRELSMMHVKQEGYCPSPAVIFSYVTNTHEADTNITTSAALIMIQSAIDEYIATLELLYAVADRNSQHAIDCWLSSWDDTASYDLMQKLK